MKMFLATVALIIASVAPAHAAQPAWVCGLDFQGKAAGVQFIVGQFKTEATGNLHCVGLGETYNRAIRITMGTSFLAPAIGLGDFAFVGAAAGISLFTLSPDDLLGNYLVEDGRAALIGGAGAFVAEKVGLPQLAVQVSLQLLHGVGFDLGIHRMTIAAQ